MNILWFGFFFVACMHTCTPVLAASSSTSLRNYSASIVLYNASEARSLYSSWYFLPKGTTTFSKAPLPKTMTDDPTGILPREWSTLRIPEQIKSDKDLFLVLSFDKELVKKERVSNGAGNSFRAVSWADFLQDGTPNIFSEPPLDQQKNQYEQEVPFFCKNQKIVSVLNSTNASMYCAPYAVYKDRDKQAKRTVTGVMAVEPQQVIFFSVPPKHPSVESYQLLFSATKNSLNSAQLTARQRELLISLTLGDAHTKEMQECIVLTPLNAQLYSTSSSSSSSAFVVIAPQEKKTPSFLLDTLLDTYHKIPALKPFERASIESDLIVTSLKKHDPNLFETITSESRVKECYITDLPDERDFVEKRSSVTQSALLRLFNKEIEQNTLPYGVTVEDLMDKELMPTLAFVSTGGGYRAMIETIGFLEGAESSGVLPCCTYMCGLSGSTWAINSLVASNKSVKEYAQELQKKVLRKAPPVEEGSWLQKVRNILTVSTVMSKDSAFNDIFNLIFDLSGSESYKRTRFLEGRFARYQGFLSLYGHGIAQRLLDDTDKKTRHSLMLSDLRSNLESQRYPLPISVCLHSRSDALARSTRWFDFSPYYVSTYDKRKKGCGWSIDTRTFGSFYVNGRLQDRCPEYTLGHLFGIFGSAMALSDDDLKLHRAGLGQACKGMLTFLTNNLGGMKIDEERVTAGVVPNFLYSDEEESFSDKPQLCEEKSLRLVDGGFLSLVDGRGMTLCHNFASIAALQGGCDILILTDCNGKPDNENSSEHLQATYREAAEYGFRLPVLSDDQKENLGRDYTDLITDDTAAPTLVYIQCKRCDEVKPGFDPDISENPETATPYFYYSESTYTRLKDLAKGLFEREAHLNNIKEAILRTIRKKKEARKKVQQPLKKSLSAESLIFQSAATNQTKDQDGLVARAATEQNSRDQLQRLADRGDCRAQYTLGRSLQKEGKSAEARHWLLRAARQGDAEAQYSLGLALDAEGDTAQAREWFLRSARGGYSHSQFTLATLYHAQGALEQAREWFVKAADQGHEQAQNKVKILKAEDKYVDKNICSVCKDIALGHVLGDYIGEMFPEKTMTEDKVLELHGNAAEQGNADAQNTLALFYLSEGNKEKALEWFERAVAKGLAKAYYNLGFFYLNEGNKEKAQDLLSKAAEQGFTKALYRLAFLFHKEGNSEKEHEFLGKAAEHGEAKAQLQLGSVYAKEGNKEKAREWFSKAGEQGLVGAQYNLGVLHEKKGNKQKAKEFYHKAAEQGYIDAQINLAFLYEDEGNKEKAKEFYQIAADKGDAQALDNLGVLYFDEGNIERAKELLSKAAEQGYASSQYNLALLYEQEGNREKAEELFRKAAEQGLPRPKSPLGLLYEKVRLISQMYRAGSR